MAQNRLPRNSWRVPPSWSWDDPKPTGGPVVGSLSQSDQARGNITGCIYIPDPESQSGWRQWWVYGNPPVQPAPRKLGL